MGIRDLFNRDADTKIVSLTNQSGAAEDMESSAYYSARVAQKNRFEPHVDFSEMSNFTKFGSAEKYYTDTISNIYTYYPFDGSFYEKVEWELSASGIQKYIFEKEYPRTNGYINLSYPEWGTIAAGNIRDNRPDDIEYILFSGGPNKDPDGTGKSLASIFAASSSNFYDSDDNREANLTMGSGITLEFWMKKSAFADTAADSYEVIFDMATPESSFGDAGYGEVALYLRSDLVTPANNGIYLRFHSGSVGDTFDFSSTSATKIVDGVWHHYAVAAENGFSTASLFIDGVLSQVDNSATPISTVTGALQATLGAQYSSVGISADQDLGAIRGWNKLSSSLDEFRFWKTARTDKQIGMNWFTQVGGGTNQDDANTDLGVYYKFNEGISLTASVDAKVLDYSGRFSDGTWTGYTSGARNTGSAMVLAGAAKSEFKDPIIYSFHPSVVSLLEDKQKLGQEFDYQNPASIYNSIPSWIMDEDDGNLSNLVQIISSFFDSFQLKVEELSQLKDVQYLSSSVKPYPFTNNALESLGMTTPNLFIEADVLEAIASRSDTEKFEEELYDIKNLIYQNIYNNLVYIYNTKGTMKSFRNLLRCYGIDEELVRINLYVDGQTYKIEDDYRLQALEKKFVNFAGTDRFKGTVYQTASNTSEASYFPASTFNHPLTYESQIIVPSKFPIDSTLWFETPFISASLFGQHKVLSGDPATWDSSDENNFQVYLAKEELGSLNAKFVLTTTLGGVLPTLESPTYKEVYDNTSWNIAVKVRPDYALYKTGSLGSGTIEFQGVQTEGDFIRNEFILTASLSPTSLASFVQNSSKFYAGAHYTNFSASLRHSTDVKITNNRVWFSYLPTEVIRVHAKDSTNYGTKNPYNDAYAAYGEITSSIPEIETLALSWGYDTLSSSDAGDGPGYTAGFTVVDLHTASAGRDYGMLAPMLTSSHPGRGDKFLANDDDVIQKEYLSNAKLQGPETVQTDDLVEIINQSDEEIFTRESRPLDYVYAIEKGMQQVISDEMINVFGSIVDFNNLIGAPVNRYRQNYDEMDKLKEIFFSRIKNTPSLIKYVEFYKWIDGAITSMIRQLVPATANFSDKVATVIESHVLERNKYWNKFPTVEVELTVPESPIIGGSADGYEGAPLPKSPLPQNRSCRWWKNRANGSSSYIPVNVFANRGEIVSASHSTYNRKVSSIAIFVGDGVEDINAGVIELDPTRQATKFGSDGYLSISTGSFEEVDCLDDT